MTELDHNTPETPGDKQAYLAGKLQGLHLKKVWMLSFILTSVIAIGPLIFFALVDYDLSRKSVESEAVLRTSRFTSNTWRSIAFFIDERKMVLNFIARDNSLADLNDKERLTEIFNNLKKDIVSLSGDQKKEKQLELINKEFSLSQLNDEEVDSTGAT